MSKKDRLNNKIAGNRQLKVGEVLRHAVSEIFMQNDFYDQDAKNISVTVSEVRISPDLKNATVFVMPLGGKNPESTLKNLQNLTPQIRSMISHKIKLRYMPSIFFKLDNSFEQASNLEMLLKEPKVLRDLEHQETTN